VERLIADYGIDSAVARTTLRKRSNEITELLVKEVRNGFGPNFRCRNWAQQEPEEGLYCEEELDHDANEISI
jgi:hypothetical protein